MVVLAHHSIIETLPLLLPALVLPIVLAVIVIRARRQERRE
jgi:hypothetical protein